MNPPALPEPAHLTAMEAHVQAAGQVEEQEEEGGRVQRLLQGLVPAIIHSVTYCDLTTTFSPISQMATTSLAIHGIDLSTG